MMTLRKKILVDTDMGVDDAVALSWLVLQKRYPIEILGVSTLAGNSDVKNAWRNASILLKQLNQQKIPVLAGAEKPLQQERSYTGAMLHGWDGLWSSTQDLPYENKVSQDCQKGVVDFWQSCLEKDFDLNLICLGPLTNLAVAEKTHPGLLKRFLQITCLGSSKYYGSYSVLAEYNFGQDPEAAKIVMDSGANIALVPIEAHHQVVLSEKEYRERCNFSALNLTFLQIAIEKYLAFNQNYFQESTVRFPDLVATILGVDSSLGKSRSALVKVITEEGLARGQSVISLEAHERLTTILSQKELNQMCQSAMEDPKFNLAEAMGEVLQRESDNAQYFFEMNSEKIKRIFFEIFEVPHAD
ncbi:MAG: nucleoside hydrolase [Deltaproteobacteria bacterium]|nr:nucleoside hydrolase [Deltaproteobacteria bacterium]